MIKRDITETVYEYDNEGKLTRKIVTETHEEEEDHVTTTTYKTVPYINDFSGITAIPCKKDTHYYNNDSITATNDMLTNITLNG